MNVPLANFEEILWSAQGGVPLLLLMQLLPLLGAGLVFLLGERRSAVTLGKVIALGELLLAFTAVRAIDAGVPALQLAERFGPLAYHVGWMG